MFLAVIAACTAELCVPVVLNDMDSMLERETVNPNLSVKS
jgi:hypothetical protein